MLDEELLDVANQLEGLLMRVNQNVDLCEVSTLYEVQSTLYEMHEFINEIIGDRPI